MEKACILLVDDEQDLVWTLRQSLDDEGYEVATAGDGVVALAVARRRRPDLVILDIVMPRLDGLQVCQALRQDPTLAAVPILFLSVRRGVMDRVTSLDEGGDDYLVKPFDLRELKARIRALLRRHRSTPEQGSGSEDSIPLLVVGLLALDLRTHQVRVGTQPVQLTPTEFALLRHLMIHHGRVFSSPQLLQQVWGYSDMADPGLVRWHIKNLRAKIESDPAHPTYIRNVHRHGYILDEPPSSASRHSSAEGQVPTPRRAKGGSAVRSPLVCGRSPVSSSPG
jgi:two-component system response regulator RpaA